MVKCIKLLEKSKNLTKSHNQFKEYKKMSIRTAVVSLIPDTTYFNGEVHLINGCVELGQARRLWHEHSMERLNMPIRKEV